MKILLAFMMGVLVGTIVDRYWGYKWACVAVIITGTVLAAFIPYP